MRWGPVLTWLRARARASQRDAEALTGIRQDRICRIERDRADVGASELVRLVEAYVQLQAVRVEDERDRVAPTLDELAACARSDAAAADLDAFFAPPDAPTHRVERVPCPVCFEALRPSGWCDRCGVQRQLLLLGAS